MDLGSRSGNPNDSDPGFLREKIGWVLPLALRVPIRGSSVEDTWVSLEKRSYFAFLRGAIFLQFDSLSCESS